MDSILVHNQYVGVCPPKSLNQNINTRQKDYYLNLQADKRVNQVTAPIDFDGHIISAEIKTGNRVVGGHSIQGNVRVD